MAYAEKYDTAFVESVWALDGTAPDLATERCDPSGPVQTLTVTIGVPELHLDVDKVGFQYVSFLIDGDDILYQSRTAFGYAHNFHDSNYATFHKIPSFREYLV